MEKQLDELIERLRAAAGPNLRTVAVFGSAATGEYQPEFSDLNVLCVFEKLDAIELEKLSPAVRPWVRRGQRPPLVFSVDGLRHSADLFPMELLDIKAFHRLLFGEDVFAPLQVPMTLHQVQLRRELRTNLIRLRQRYLAAQQDPKGLLGLMLASVSTFTSLFRHVLLALGQQAPPRERENVDKMTALFHFEPAAFHSLLDVREDRRRAKELDAQLTFRAYLQAITRVVEEVDQRLAAQS